MFSGLWPGVPEAEAPIRAVTNGVHARTWVSAEMDELLNRYVLPEWPEADDTRWMHIADANDDEAWRGEGRGAPAPGGFAPPPPGGRAPAPAPARRAPPPPSAAATPPAAAPPRPPRGPR